MAKAVFNRRVKGSGRCRQLPSGRWQAKIKGTDDIYYPATQTFVTKMDAEAWLAAQLRDLKIGHWVSPNNQAQSGTLAEYSVNWLATRNVRPRVLIEYQRDLTNRILPDLGDVLLERMTPAMINKWFAKQDSKHPSARAHAYDTLRNMLNTAVDENVITVNPCKIKGASKSKTPRKSRPATLDEVGVMVDHMPDRYKAMLLIAVWCGLRFGEITELRRKDIDLDEGVIRIRRAVVKVGSNFIVGETKSEAGVRDVDIPPHLFGVIQAHLDEHVAPGSDALLFPSMKDPARHMSQSTLTKVYYPAREAAGRPDLRWHDLRHTGATLAAVTGATLADLMERLGHSTVQAAMIYQHAAQGRGKEIAAKLSEIARVQSETAAPHF
jgi:integrase